MTYLCQVRVPPVINLRRRGYGIVAVGCWSLVAATGSASLPVSNELGIRFKIIAAGPTATVEIRLKPHRDFASVSVEAASGVASLTPPCGFANVVVGGSYVCRVEVTGQPSDPAMTLNVVARHAAAGGGLPETEIHHLSVKNASFVASKKAQAASHHVVTSAVTTSK